MNRPLAKSTPLLGIRFVQDPIEALIPMVLRGGLLVAPSGPGLAMELQTDPAYRAAIAEADFVLPDSGAMVLFARLLHGRKLERLSGLKFLKAFLQKSVVQQRRAIFWVHPSPAQRRRNEDWLLKNGLTIDAAYHHIAPHYDRSCIADPALFEKLCTTTPLAVILCVGGGVQEPLGLWLREQYRAAQLPCPAILCTGAAIGFLSGNQPTIPTWADRLFLGWLIRIIHQPIAYLPRYLKSLPLFSLIRKYPTELPPLKAGRP